ncbi:MAG: hypothetical protein AAFV80_12070, partial [Bacteroidota bacterium]
LPSSFFLLPSSFFLLPSSFFLSGYRGSLLKCCSTFRDGSAILLPKGDHKVVGIHASLKTYSLLHKKDPPLGKHCCLYLPKLDQKTNITCARKLLPEIGK